MSLHFFSRKQGGGSATAGPSSPEGATGAPGKSPDDLKQWWDQQRYAAIVLEKNRWRTHPAGPSMIQMATDKLEDRLRFVPGGVILLSKTLNDFEGSPDETVEVAPFLIDTLAVTNRQFQHFVEAGGYDNLDLWPDDVWPHLIEFCDSTGEYGPRYWTKGQYPKGRERHPVVGLSWFEANAYARWVGQRLPTEAEWEMTVNWRLHSEAKLVQRPYPWGNSMDKKRCNTWSAGLRETAPVDAFGEGDTLNGVRQLIGNTWEWLDSDLVILDDENRPITGDMVLKSIRGGAFDTYFEWQASSHFRTGQVPFSRSHNIGFRCAIGLEDAPWAMDSLKS
jgi:iron(II)-dependent oxidoreductase